jgi:hypothetical protein
MIGFGIHGRGGLTVYRGQASKGTEPTGVRCQGSVLCQAARKGLTAKEAFE